MDLNKVRMIVKRSGLCMYEFSQLVGVSESTLFRWLRSPLTDEREEKIGAALLKIGVPLCDVQEDSPLFYGLAMKRGIKEHLIRTAGEQVLGTGEANVDKLTQEFERVVKSNERAQ